MIGQIKDKTQEAITERAGGVRMRAWTLATMFAVALLFYLFLNVVFGNEIRWTDLIFMFIIQASMSAIWFPEGQEFGKRDKVFKANRTRYNMRAEFLVSNRKLEKLREFCEHDYRTRINEYTQRLLSRADITETEFAELKDKPAEMFRRKDKTLKLNNKQKRILKQLIFKSLPIEKNDPETIMSGVETNGYTAIQNGERTYTRNLRIVNIFRWTVGATLLAYISYQFRDGISFATFVRAFLYLTIFFLTIVKSFTQGEDSIKKHRNAFYLRLCDFIDRFVEWGKFAITEKTLGANTLNQEPTAPAVETVKPTDE